MEAELTARAGLVLLFSQTGVLRNLSQMYMNHVSLNHCSEKYAPTTLVLLERISQLLFFFLFSFLSAQCGAILQSHTPQTKTISIHYFL